MAKVKSHAPPPTVRPLVTGTALLLVGMVAMLQMNAWTLLAIPLLPLAGYTLGHAVNVPGFVTKLLVGR